MKDTKRGLCMIFEIKEKDLAVREEDRLLLKQSGDFPMIYVGRGEETIGMYRGNFQIQDYVTERYPLAVKSVSVRENTMYVDFDGRIQADIIINKDLLEISFKVLDDRINRFWMRIPADREEHCYGCGEQMSYFNLRGRNFPLWTSEPGVGRDKTTYVTWQSDVQNKAGGDYYHTNFPQPSYVSDKHYCLWAETTAYAEFNFKNEHFHELHFWKVPEKIRIVTAPSYRKLLERQSDFMGRQPDLPDWVFNGIVLGLQGGSDRVADILEKTLAHGIPVSAVWCQDWCGKRETSFGRRLQWNWMYDEKMYPQLQEKIQKLHDRGIKFMGYINPYLVNDGELYQEGLKKGYFAKHADGSEYLVDFGEFDCGVVDLTNPEAYAWFKNDVIKKYLTGIGMDGWMADFGEYLPVDDIVLYNGRSAMEEHNHWPVLWAKCNYDAVKETGSLGKVVYFMRAGGAGSQKYCTLLWAGDQCVDFSLHDGLRTTISAALSSGMSGCGLSHSDIGGYTSLFGNIRTKEVFLRWAEMAVFTPFMRTHEGNRPDTNFQYYEDEDTMNRLARLVDIYRMLSVYTKTLTAENARCGMPVQRPLFIHYEDDPEAYEIEHEYLMGADVLAAPVYLEGQSQWEVYLPEDEWVHFWTGKIYHGGRHMIMSPLGYTPAFYRKESRYADVFEAVTKKYGIQ